MFVFLPLSLPPSSFTQQSFVEGKGHKVRTAGNSLQIEARGTVKRSPPRCFSPVRTNSVLLYQYKAYHTTKPANKTAQRGRWRRRSDTGRGEQRRERTRDVLIYKYIYTPSRKDRTACGTSPSLIAMALDRFHEDELIKDHAIQAIAASTFNRSVSVLIHRTPTRRTFTFRILLLYILVRTYYCCIRLRLLKFTFFCSFHLRSNNCWVRSGLFMFIHEVTRAKPNLQFAVCSKN